MSETNELSETTNLSPAKQALLERRRKRSALTVVSTIRPHSDRDRAPLSFAEQRLWFLDQLEPNSAFYNVPRLLRIHGPLEPEVMRQALNAFVQRHEVVRTVFPAVDGKPVQRILPALALPVAIVDISEVPEPAREQELSRLLAEESKRPFDLARGPLFRASLFRLAAEDSALLIVTHHIISDEGSANILYEELGALYQAFVHGKPSPLPELSLQYADYAVWQREYLQGEVLEDQFHYWRKQLDDAPEVMNLPTDRARPVKQTFGGSIESRTFAPQLRDSLNAVSRRERCTPFMTSLAAFAVLLWHYTRQEDVVVGTVVSNRDAETEKLVGLFLNSLPLRVVLSGNPTFAELLDRVRRVALEAYAYQDLPFEKLVEELRPERSLTHNPLFQVLFTNRAIERPVLNVGGISMQPVDVPTGTSKFDLAVFVGEGQRGLSVAVEYNTDLFEVETIERLLEHYHTVLRGALGTPDRPISDIPILPKEEQQQIIVAWNDTQKNYPLTLVHEMFEAQAARTPEAIAVTWGGGSLTYDQLNRQANQLAQYLRKHHARAQSLVGICMERSLELIVGVMGTLKAGAAYVPLDPDYPKDRLAFMLEDSGAEVLLTQQHLAGSLPWNRSRVVCLDALDASSFSEQNFSSGARLEDLVYVIFTSGSTGRPKGVCLPHRALSNLLFWQFENSRAAAGTRTLQFTSLSFDVSFQEIFSTLCGGGTLVLIDDALRRDAAGMLRYLRENQINRLFLPFVALQNLAEAAEQEFELPATLHEVITAGEQLQITPQIAELFRRLPDCRLYNHYGPSESHVVTAYTLSGAIASWPTLPPIGTPISNTQIYILDSRLQPVPTGASGELYIGGVSLATGYLKRPDLTQERFVPNPFHPGTRLCRTGDLARYRANGSIDYLGRIDNQVKIRGHRIELGEIEAVLREHASVAASVVISCQQQGNKFLAAYIVAKSAAKADSLILELREYLKDRLPEYMVPAAFVLMDQLPLTASGKINRRALPEPDLARSESVRYTPPRTPVEEMLAAIWAHVLHVDKVGIHDDFFTLGGHSLLATQVISRIAQSLEVKLPLRVLFERSTVARLAQYIASDGQREKSTTPPAIVPISRDCDLTLSFAQQRLWLLSQIVGSSAAYNAPEVMRIRGPLDPKVLERSINEIVRRHEVLRTTYRLSHDQPRQMVTANMPIPLLTKDVSALPEAEGVVEAKRLAQEDIRRPFDLARGPVLRALLVRLADDDHVLAITFHHIATDGWSMGVFDSEMAVIYDAFAEGRPSPLPDLTIQVADHACWQRNWMRDQVLENHLEFWRGYLAGALPRIDVPTDQVRPQATSFEGARQYAHLSSELAEKLKGFSKREGATLFMTMLSAIEVLLFQWTRQRDLVLGTIIANRNHVETENLVGCFMNFLPLRAVISDDDTARDVLKQTKKSVMQAYSHEDCPFEKIIEELNPQRATSSTPLYNVIFLLQNFPEIAFKNRTLEARFMPMGMEAVHMDLRFAAGEASAGMWIVCDYRRDLFQPDTIDRLLGEYCSTLERLVTNPESKVADFMLAPDLVAQAEKSRRQNQKCRIAIAATFTADLLEQSTTFWMHELEIASEVRFAPFNQVFQQLLDPHSELSRNQFGLNVVLLRLEDWWHGEPGGAGSTSLELRKRRVTDNVEQLLRALSDAARRSPVPYLLCLCPAWRDTLADAGVADFFYATEQRIADTLRSNGAVHTITPSDLAALYPLAQWEDRNAYELGHIPYTQEFFTALGTAIARRFYRIHTPPHKVMVLDCDTTLWREAGDDRDPADPASKVDAAAQVLQEFVLAQIKAGMLVCVCSRTQEDDVWKVFDQDPGMLLHRDHMVSWRINSEPTSAKLKELSAELQLELDSFLFLTGNHQESAEVEAHCPEVLLLELPQNETDLSIFLSHVWAFDHLAVGSERFYSRQVQLDEFSDAQLSSESQAAYQSMDRGRALAGGVESGGRSK